MEGLPRWNAPCKLLPEFRSQALRPIFYLGSVVISNRRYLAVILQPSFVVGNLTYCFVHKLLHNRVGFFFKALQLVVKVVKIVQEDNSSQLTRSTIAAFDCLTFNSISPSSFGLWFHRNNIMPSIFYKYSLRSSDTGHFVRISCLMGYFCIVLSVDATVAQQMSK